MDITTRESELNGQAAIQPTILVCLFLLGIWIFAHPWEGIWHDSRLYAIQALYHLRPEAYRNDLFFLYGSQDKYTLFSPIYAALISRFDLYAATITLLLAGYILWVGSAVLLIRRLLRGFPFWLGLTLIFSMSRDYSGLVDLFKYAESFLTPRLFSEGLTLLSLAMMLSGKRLAALAAMAAALVMHPLMVLAGAGFVYLYAALDRPKTALAGGAMGLILLLGLASFNITPFNHMLAAMDKPWYELILSRSPMVLWDRWNPEDMFNHVLISFGLLAAAGIAAKGTHKRVFLASLILGLLSLLLTWLGTSLFHNLLVIQIQPWRSLWLTQLFSYIAAAWLVAEFWDHGQSFRILLLGFLTATLTPGNAGSMLAMLVTFLFIWQERTGKVIPISRTSNMLLWLIPILAGILWVTTSWFVTDANLTAISPQAHDFVSFSVIWIKELLDNGGGGIIALGLFILPWRYGPDHRKSVRLVTATSVMLLLLLSMVLWYRPIKQESYYERRTLLGSIPSLTRHIPVGAVVYWANDPKMTWFALGRANYASRLQTAGIVFSRQTAIEGKRRMDRLTALGQEDSIFTWAGNTASLNWPTAKGLVHVCHDPKLDFVVLSENYGIGVIERYSEKVTEKNFYLYDCSYLRRHYADTWNDRPKYMTGNSQFSISQSP